MIYKMREREHIRYFLFSGFSAFSKVYYIYTPTIEYFIKSGESGELGEKRRITYRTNRR